VSNVSFEKNYVSFEKGQKSDWFYICKGLGNCLFIPFFYIKLYFMKKLLSIVLLIAFGLNAQAQNFIKADQIKANLDKAVLFESESKPGHYLMDAGQQGVFVFKPISNEAELAAATFVIKASAKADQYVLHYKNLPIGHHGWVGKHNATGGRESYIVAALSGDASAISMHQGADPWKATDYWRLAEKQDYNNISFDNLFSRTYRIGEPTDQAGRKLAGFKVTLASEFPLTKVVTDKAVLFESEAKPGYYLMDAGQQGVFVFKPISNETELAAATFVIKASAKADQYVLHYKDLPIGHHGWVGKHNATGGRESYIVAALSGTASAISMHQGIDPWKATDYWRLAEKQGYNNIDFDNLFSRTYRIGEPTDEAGRKLASFKVTLAADFALYTTINSAGDIVKNAAFFNAAWYSQNNPDIVKNGFQGEDGARLHFINHGLAEGRQSSPTFSVTYYKDNNADLQKLFGNDHLKYYQHYVTFGKKEGRKTVQ
jgi:hypothetical protein